MRWTLRHVAAGLAAPFVLVAGPAASAQGIVWQGSLSRQPVEGSEIVVSTVAGGEPRVSIRRPGAGQVTARPPLPVASNLLGLAAIRPFGADGRCTAEAGAEPVLRCRPGESIAGFVLDFGDLRLPEGAPLRLVLDAEGHGFRAQLTARGAEANDAQPLAEGTNSLPVARVSAETVPQLILLAPEAGGELRLRDLRLIGDSAGARAMETSAWAWDASQLVCSCPSRLRTARFATAMR